MPFVCFVLFLLRENCSSLQSGCLILAKVNHGRISIALKHPQGRCNCHRTCFDSEGQRLFFHLSSLSLHLSVLPHTAYVSVNKPAKKVFRKILTPPTLQAYFEERLCVQFQTTVINRQSQ